MPGTWSEADDRKLWSLSKQYKTTAQLASTFGKTNGAIRARLKHLQDPTHKAYKRRVGSSSAAAESTSTSMTRGMSGFASRYNASKNKSASLKRCAIDLTDSSPSPPMASRYFADSPPTKLKQSITAAESQKREKQIDSSSLNADQKSAAEYIFSGGNAFLTGAAGVGKSYLLNHVIRGLRAKHEPGSSQRSTHSQQKPNNDSAVVVAAATGIAATHINGVTIHSWAGVRLGKGGARVLVPRVLGNAAACQRWQKAKVLILDEVSMIDGMFFEALDAIGREARRRPSQPFGGIQLVLSGDFFQLPPVSLNGCGFAFEAPAWSKAGVKMVELNTVVRQSGDTTFIDMLNRIRLGVCPDDITRALEACHVSRKGLPADGIVPTKLYCTNRNVDEENNRNLAHLPAKERVFPSDDVFKGNYSKQVRESLSQTMDKKIPSELRLKVGAQVIITRNMPNHNLVNGSRGVIVSFQEEGKDDPFSSHAGYGNGRKGKSSSYQKLYPLVQFSNGVRMLVQEENVFQGSPSGAMTRSQLPLKLAWSLTVHKSQGMTIERAELQLDDAFDFGQVYVALSRVTSLEGLWVRGGRITQSVVKAHPKVKAFYRTNGSAILA